jgi:hypothetical protein
MKTKFRSSRQLLPFTLFFVFLALGLMFFNSGCNKDKVDPDPGPSNSITQQFSSDTDGGVISMGDFDLIISPNSIPALSNGNAATVTFSIETNGALPKPLPGTIDKESDLVHFGPEGFIFQEPLFVMLPLPAGTGIENLAIITFDNETESYKVYPTTYYDPATNTVGTGVYNLGYFFLGKVEGLTEDLSVDKGQGGFQLNDNNSDWYPIDGNTWQLTGRLGPWSKFDNYHNLYVQDIDFKFEDQRNWYVDFTRWVVRTPPKVTGFKPNHDIGIKFFGPQGRYTWNLRISHKYFQNELPECQDYSIPWIINIDKPVNCGITGCTDFTTPPGLQSNGSWTFVDCLSNRPAPTDPVCTGEFQVTLTWHNGTSGDTDLDLHLVGPNGLEVSWENETGEGDIMLDRDIISTPGYVQENICAPFLNNMPRGEYRIEVHHFSGLEKDFQVRVVRGNYSNSYSGTLANENIKVIETFKLD